MTKNSTPAVVWTLVAAKLLFHLLTAGRYGIFRDELYYLACSEHLDWGYVDQPPLIALVAWLARHPFGESLLALRWIPALAGAATVWLAAILAREMGGGRVAQAMAALAVLATPIYLIMHHWLTMNAFEPLIWMGCVWCVVQAVKRDQPHYWIWFGVLAGLGLENKYTTAFFVAAMVGALICTPGRRFLATREFWLGSLLALLIFLPNLVWLVRHDFPFLQLMHNIRMGHRDVVRGPVAFVIDQAMLLNPFLFPLWLGGLIWLLVRTDASSFRIFGLTYLFLLAVFIVLKTKNYYLAPIYPLLYAAGAVAFEKFTAARWRWGRVVYTTLVIASLVALAPTVSPILSPERTIAYQKKIGLEPPKAENQNTGPLPQYFADEFGWDELAREVARVYNNLPANERAPTAIFANSYGEAAAIDFFGPRYGLPKAVSNHQSYWFWGPRDYTGATVIVLGSDGRGDREHFQTVEAAGRIEHPYSRRDEHFDIFLCRGLNADLRTLWPQLKKWD
jgi:hypothetical protein